MRAELLAAEHEARNKKRKAEGLPPLEDLPSNAPPLDEETSKRRKLLQEALELDKDDDDEDDDEDKGKEKESEKDNDRCVVC